MPAKCRFVQPGGGLTAAHLVRNRGMAASCPPNSTPSSHTVHTVRAA
jgi:hypothetical protein